jgi:prepilin-type N-terminal cleavage/methylation domain-containing protein
VIPHSPANPSRYAARGLTGFTLVEILVVVVIVGVLAAAASLMLVSRARAATLDDTFRRAAFVDAFARRTARRGGRPVEILIDVDHGIICVVADEGAPGDPPVRGPTSSQSVHGDRWIERLTVPYGHRISRVWMLAAQAEAASIGPEEWDAGVIAVPCSAAGYTPTYGILIESGTESRRLLFAGLTGERGQVAQDDQVRSMGRVLRGDPDNPADGGQAADARRR